MTTEPMTLAHHLPPGGRELAGVIGLDAVLALSSAYGGVTLTLPRAGASPWLAALIGPDKAAALCRHQGGLPLYVPRCARARQRMTDRRILADRRAGMRLSDLALRYQRTVRSVSNALRRAEAQELWLHRAFLAVKNDGN